MSVSGRMLNEAFINKLGSAEGKEKTAEYGGSYIRDRLREVSFARKAQERDLYEEQTDLLKRAKEAYLVLASEGNWAVLDGTRGVEGVFADLWSRVMELLASRGYGTTPSLRIPP